MFPQKILRATAYRKWQLSKAGSQDENKLSDQYREACSCAFQTGSEMRTRYLFDGQPQSEACTLIRAHVQLVLLVELLSEVVKEDLIEVAASHVSVPGQRQHFQLAALESHHHNLRRKKALIVPQLILSGPADF